MTRDWRLRQFDRGEIEVNAYAEPDVASQPPEGWAGNAGRARPLRRIPLADRRGAVPMTSTAQAGDGRFDHVTFISAGAGSGKTYRLIEELEKAFVEDGIPAAGVRRHDIYRQGRDRVA